jgi:hypothetical protein
VLDDLFSTLDRMGIEHLGSESVDNTVLVGSRVSDPFADAPQEELDDEDVIVVPPAPRRTVTRRV